MNIGKKFAITTVILSIIEIISIIGMVAWAFDLMNSDITLDSIGVGLIPIIMLVISTMSKLVMGILELAIVTNDKTQYRGLHIANGILCILGGMISVIVIGSILISKENKIINLSK